MAETSDIGSSSSSGRKFRFFAAPAAGPATLALTAFLRTEEKPTSVSMTFCFPKTSRATPDTIGNR